MTSFAATNDDRQWMWACADRALPPLFNPTTSTTSLPLASTFDPLDLSEKRVEYHLERSLKLTPTPEDIPALERAVELFATLKDAPSEELGAEILQVLTGLELHQFKEGGPLELPSPTDCPERVLHYAQLSFESLDESMAWSDQSTLEWAIYSLTCGDDAIAVTSMNLLSHIEDTQTHEVHNGQERTADEVFALLHPLLLACATMPRESPIFAFHPVVEQQVNKINGMESLPELKSFCKLYTDTFEEVYEELYDGEFDGVSVANCDTCQSQLILPEYQRCPKNCELQVKEVQDSKHVCDYCGKQIQPGTVIRSCESCDFDLCQCCGGPWWHKSGCSDLCIHHYDGDAAGYVRIEQKEDLGAELEEYFEEEGEGEWLGGMKDEGEEEATP